MTLLVNRVAAAKSAASTAADTLLSRARSVTPRGEYVTMPMLGRVWVELAGEMVVDEIEGAVNAAMKALDIPPTALNGATYDSRRAALTLAWAVRDPDSHETRAGTQEQWLALDLEFDLRVQRRLHGRQRATQPAVASAVGRGVRGNPPGARKKKSSDASYLRCRFAVELSCYYGRPACELTDDAAVGWAIGARHFPTVEESRARASERGDGAPPAGVLRFINTAFDGMAS